jgi:peroxiredoxin
MRILTVLFLLVTASLCGCGGPGSQPGPTPTAQSSPGQLSPSFNLTAVDGSAVSYSPTNNPNGDVTLLAFWSYSFDSNVKVLLSRLAELHERYAPRGLRLISIAYQEEPANLRNFLSTNKTPFPVAVGVDSTYQKFALKSIPTAILIDKSGKIVHRWEGHYSTEEMSTVISGYLPGRDGNSKP